MNVFVPYQEPDHAIRALQRARGHARLVVKDVDGTSRIADLHQEGTAKIKFPNVPPLEPLEAILINTGGGMTGGDRFRTDVELDANTSAIVTTQACEKIYRARDGVVDVTNTVRVGPGARLDWLPQETILFDRGAIDRRLDIEMEWDSRVLAVEAIVLGRTGMGETVEAGSIREAFRIRRDGRLIFADTFRLDGPIAQMMARPAIGAGAKAFATILIAGRNVESRLDEVRAVMEGWEDAGATTFEGLMVIRLLAVDGAALRRRLVALLGQIRGGALPRVWST